MDEADPMRTARMFFDPTRLSETIGVECVARRLRHKPGLSTVAALHDADGVYGWAQLATPGHDAKIEKARRRAARLGLTMHVRQLADGLTLAFGEVNSDPRLIKAWRELTPGLKEAMAEGGVVRYNPLRRAVLRTEADGAHVSVRLHHDPKGAVAAASRARAVAAAGVPTNEQLRRTKYTSTWSWVGEHDLSQLAGDERRDAARRAGAALAKLHAVAPSAGTAVEFDRTQDSLVRIADDLSVLDAGLGMRLLDLVGRARIHDEDPVSAHGDFSADQVAVGGSSIWLLDLDRFGQASRGLDFGSFHAVELLDGVEPVTAELLAGYGGPSLDELHGWVFAGLARRIMEPLRDAEPEWQVRIEERLDQLEEWAG